MVVVRTQMKLASLASLDNGEAYFVPGFYGYVDGERLLVTAVLERTAVVDRDGIRMLVNKAACFVEPGSVEIKHVADQAAARRSRARGTLASKKETAAKLSVVARPELDVVDDEAALEVALGEAV